MKERSSSFFFWLCSRVVGDARFLGGSVLCFFAARLHGGGAAWMYGSAGILALASS